jgi:hypothetical protein
VPDPTDDPEITERLAALREVYGLEGITLPGESSA